MIYLCTPRYKFRGRKDFSKCWHLGSSFQRPLLYFLGMSKIHLQSWEQNSALNVSYQQFYSLQQREHLQTYRVLPQERVAFIKKSRFLSAEVSSAGSFISMVTASSLSILHGFDNVSISKFSTHRKFHSTFCTGNYNTLSNVTEILTYVCRFTGRHLWYTAVFSFWNSMLLNI